MAIDKSIYVPIMTETSLSVESPFFHVFLGEVAIIQAFGFKDYKERADKSELLVPQVACLEMLLFKEGVIPKRKAETCPVWDLRQYQTQLLAKETMRHNDCTYELSKCNNIMLLHIPGSYRFILNDQTAVGDARIYLRIVTKDEFPWDSKFLLGE